MDLAMKTISVVILGMLGTFALGFCAGVAYEVSQNIKVNLKKREKGEIK